MTAKTPFRIVPKRDWPRAYGALGFLINDEWVHQGFVVTDGICNIMPGATWFRSIPEAMHAIDVLCSVHGDGQAFWRAIR